MNTYIIGYDLNRPGQGYHDLFEAIKDLGAWGHYLDSTWIVKSAYNAVQIRDCLSPYLDANDELLVACLSGEAAWIGFNSDGSAWLKQNL
jgi:hypothetical protein